MRSLIRSNNNNVSIVIIIIIKAKVGIFWNCKYSGQFFSTFLQHTFNGGQTTLSKFNKIHIFVIFNILTSFEMSIFQYFRREVHI